MLGLARSVSLNRPTGRSTLFASNYKHSQPAGGLAEPRGSASTRRDHGACDSYQDSQALAY